MTRSTAGAFVDLERAAIGRPVTRLGVSFFPVYLMDNPLPAIATGPKSGRVIEELADASVPTLTAANPTERPILLVEGEQFLGGDQNRTLNVSVLVPAAAKLQIPVSCLEAGRWGSRRDFAAGSTYTPAGSGGPRTRRSPGRRRPRTRAVATSTRCGLDRRRARRPPGRVAHPGDGRGRLGVRARARRRAAANELGALGPLPGQCGVVVTHGPRVVAAEVFGAPGLLQPHWAALVRSCLLERPTANGRPSASRVLRKLGRISKAACRETPGLGLGVECHLGSPRAVGQALTLESAVVHASVLSA